MVEPGRDVVVVPDGEELAEGVVVDERGLVDGWEFHFDLTDAEMAQAEPLTEMDDVMWLAAPPPAWDLRVLWTGLPCNVRPTVQVDGDGGMVTAITVAVGPEVVPDTDPPADCDAMEARHAVDLRATAEVSPDLELSRKP